MSQPKVGPRVNVTQADVDEALKTTVRFHKTSVPTRLFFYLCCFWLVQGETISKFAAFSARGFGIAKQFTLQKMGKAMPIEEDAAFLIILKKLMEITQSFAFLEKVNVIICTTKGKSYNIPFFSGLQFAGPDVPQSATPRV
jgi:hypothetical protein